LLTGDRPQVAPPDLPMELSDPAQETVMPQPENREPLADRPTVEHHLQVLALATAEDLDDLLTELLCCTHRTLRAQTN
jgi:hypothetical protein